MFIFLLLFLLTTLTTINTDGIPKVIHFAFFPNHNTSLSLLQYAAIRSAYQKWNQPLMYFWHTSLPTGETPYFDLIRPILTLKRAEIPLDSVQYRCLKETPEKVGKWIALTALQKQGGIYLDINILWLKSPPSSWFSRRSDIVMGNEALKETSIPELSTSMIMARPNTTFLQAIIGEYERKCLCQTSNYFNMVLPSKLWFKHSENILVFPKERLYSTDWDDYLDSEEMSLTISKKQIAYRVPTNYQYRFSVPEAFWKETWFNILLRPFLLGTYWQVFQRSRLEGLNNWPRKCPLNPCFPGYSFKPSDGCHQKVKKPPLRLKKVPLLVRQIYLPGHGHFGYYYEARNICIGVYLNDQNEVKLIQQVYLPSEDPHRIPFSKDETVNYYGVPTNFMFWLRKFESTLHFPSVTSPSFYAGTTLFLENSAGWPQHIGHFSEGLWKVFSFIPQTVRNVDRFWILNRLGLANDWEHTLLKIALNGARVELKDDQEFRRVVFQESNGAGLNKNLLCFERAIFPQMTQRWFMSDLNVQEMRQRVDKYCRVKRNTNRKRPVLAYIPRQNYRRILNAEAVLRLGAELGFDIAPPITNLTDFCGQVQLFSSLDVIFSKHGTHFSGMVFMNPYSVAIEVNNPGLRHKGRRISEWKLNAYYGHINYLESDDAIIANHQHFHNSDSEEYLKNLDVEIPLDVARKYLLYALKIWRDPTHRQHSCMQPGITEPTFGSTGTGEDGHWPIMWENNEEFCRAY